MRQRQRRSIFCSPQIRACYQQNLSGRKIAIVVLTGTTKGPRVRLQQDHIAGVVNAAKPGSYFEVAIPFDSDLWAYAIPQ